MDRTARPGGRLEVDDLALPEAFSAQPLDPDTLRVLRYMHDIESHTACYLRDALVKTQFVVRHLFDDEQGLAAMERIDRRIDRLPGQVGLGLMARARHDALAS
ncbi:MAG: hypothetical protein ACT452_13645 [Microthrixaceae bacterium]